VTDSRPDDLVPASVSLGAVVPPEDPEDWTRPLTWVVAAGMLVAPIALAAWFLAAAPETAEPELATYVVAALVAGGAAATGATQRGGPRAAMATLGAALFAGLLAIVIGVAAAGERQVGNASPTVSHATGAAVAGLAGAATGALVAVVAAGLRRWVTRFVLAAFTGGAVAALVVATLMGARV
jgi:hypothetical protein